MVAQAFERRGFYAAIGTLNFAGDLGKMAGPALAAVPAVSLGWRPTLMMVGGAGIAFMRLSLLAKVGPGTLPTVYTGFVCALSRGGLVL